MSHRDAAMARAVSHTALWDVGPPKSRCNCGELGRTAGGRRECGFTPARHLLRVRCPAQAKPLETADIQDRLPATATLAVAEDDRRPARG